MKLPFVARILFLCATAAGAGAGAPDSGPATVDESYPMSTDRPDITESPFTVWRGHWQMEMEAVSVSRDGGRHWEDWGSVNLKYGLSRHTDIQLVTPAWHTGDDGDGWSDTELRFKWNLTGQENMDIHHDGAGHASIGRKNPVAVALMPYIKLPTADHDIGNGDVEGGLIVPIDFTETPLAYMVQADLIRNEADTGYTGAFTFTATYGIEFSDNLSGFAEFVTTLPLEGSAESYANAGVVYEITPSWVFDAGINIGLNDDATDLRIFTGMSRRF